MKNLLKQSAPRPRPEFAANLEQNLLKNGTWEKSQSSFHFSQFIKRHSFISVSALLLVAIGVGVLYPLTQKPKDYVAQAKAFYDEYEPDGILYQKEQIYEMSPKETYDADATYTMERWSYQNNELTLTQKLAGKMWEISTSDELHITDDYGNTYMYANPKEYATKKDPVTESPYCVQVFSTENETEKQVFSRAFEVSPQALANTSDNIYRTGGGTSTYKKDIKAATPATQPDPGTEALRMTIADALYAPEQAKLLFDLLSDGQAYTQESRINDIGETLEVFRLPPVDYNVEYSDAQSIEEFIFNEHYELLEYNTYKNEKLMTQTKYLETRVLPSSEKERIFKPEPYGFELVSFEHPLDLVYAEHKDSPTQDLTCYSFQNKPLSSEETNTLTETYAPLFEYTPLFNIHHIYPPAQPIDPR